MWDFLDDSNELETEIKENTEAKAYTWKYV